LQVGVGFNADISVPEITRYARLADVQGFHSMWMHEHSFGRDAISYLSCIANSTENIRNGVACLSPFVRHPVLLAVSAATLQEASRGRTILGIGTGFPMRLDLMGIKHEKPIAAIRETIEICRSIWNGGALNYAGKVFSVKNVKSLIGKTQKVPIYIAGWKQQMLSLTGKYADGYVAKGGESTQSIRQIVSAIQTSAEKAARKIDQIQVCAYLLTLVDKSKDIAVERARRDPFVAYMLSVQDDYLYEGTGIDPEKKKPIAESYFKGNLSEASSFITRDMIDSFTVVGTHDEIASRVSAYRKAGLNLPILQPISMQNNDIMNVLAAGNSLIAASS
jgi:5,10-methylenetetrahydromethanopterin reductase